MRDHDYRTLVVDQRSLQDCLTRQIELVCRFVEQQQVPLHQRKMGKCDAAPFPAREGIDPFFHCITRKKKPTEKAVCLPYRKIRTGENYTKNRIITPPFILCLTVVGDPYIVTTRYQA